MDEEYDEVINIREQIFHNTVREYIIFFLLFILLYVLSYAIIDRFRRRDREDYYALDDTEVSVYRTSLYMSTFSLAVAIGGALLLPISIISNEVLLSYPKSYYVKWLNSSLIQGLWSLIFLFSNVSLFVLLPFSYLFPESEGFAGYRKSVKSRVYETLLVLGLLGVAVLGLTHILSSILDKDKSSISLWAYYLPFLYSCISFLGVLVLLLSTPLGFVRLFSVVGRYLVKPQFLRDLGDEYAISHLEVSVLRRRLNVARATGNTFTSPQPMASPTSGVFQEDDDKWKNIANLSNGELEITLASMLNVEEKNEEKMYKQLMASPLEKNLYYPVAMLVLLSLTGITLLIVLKNMLQLLAGMKELPLSTEQFTLGIESLSALGPYGAALEIVLIFYLVVTSSVGLYSLPCLSNIRPRLRQTALSHVIGNCTLALVLSTALPLLSRILGITNFDLLGDFGRIEWLGNFKIVLLYNVVFAGAFTLCLVNKFTANVRRELFARLQSSLLNLFMARPSRLYSQSKDD